MVKTRMNKGKMRCNTACVKHPAYGFTGMRRGPQIQPPAGSIH
ncbi:hypothetical protein PCO31110_02211 [Pandoraea communis]|uniref:Uncharacterized protein n=1 Tax=Pandoraea communis TaxID=2508297 RepID=A0A5E4US76_9BURK|nr:hypothetical protein PCO31110_02211 [Pandoraea communis]